MNAGLTPLDAAPAELRISILHVPDCPLISRVRETLEAALESVGATAAIEEIEGEYPSPTLLIDGVEIDGYPLGSDPACRVNLPTIEEITTAIRAAFVQRIAQTHGDGGPHLGQRSETMRRWTRQPAAAGRCVGGRRRRFRWTPT